jgi:hypothetical protein
MPLAWGRCTVADLCPQDRDWLEWATDRWLELDSGSPEAGELLSEIFRENGRRWLRRDPRRLRRRDVLRRRDAQTLRDLIWMRNRKMLRARSVTLRSVPVVRQIEPVQVGLFGSVAHGLDLHDGGRRG